MILGGGGKSVSEREKLVETKSAGSDEMGWVKDDVVGDAQIIGVRNEAAIRTIVRESGAEVETNQAKIVPSFSPSIVYNDECATRSDRM